MRKRFLIAALILAAFPAAAEAAMPLPVFLARAEALEKRGMMALFSGEIKVLKGEIAASTSSLHTERLAAKAAGRPQAYCPPADSGSMNSNELLAALRQIPPAQRAHMDVKDGMRTFLARKFPCR